MNYFQISLILTTILCSLVAGMVLAFTIVVMPGIKNLRDRDFLQAFKEIDRVIQNNQPVFILVWLGSVVTLVASVFLSNSQLEGIDWLLIIAATIFYLLGVQLPTATINVPLNNRLQALDFNSMNNQALQEARLNFEPRWVRWNTIRTVFAILTAVLLVFLIVRL